MSPRISPPNQPGRWQTNWEVTARNDPPPEPPQKNKTGRQQPPPEPPGMIQPGSTPRIKPQKTKPTKKK